MPGAVLIAVLVLVLLVALATGILGIVALRSSKKSDDLAPALREEFDRSRAESQLAAKELRGELSESIARMSAQVSGQMTQIATVQNSQIDAFSRQLVELTTANERRLLELRDTLDRKLGEMRQMVEARLEAIQKDNGEKLERMRQTVDEKLHATLEQRLGESFKTVRDQLDKVHAGLGEMQSLAAGVGDLKRVLTNVKTRGTWGEVQLENLLDQILTREQYEKNVETRPGSGERVEIAIRLPGRLGEGQVWLPIDSKFPVEDYDRLLAAQDLGDIAGMEVSSRAIETRLKLEARSIHDKYIESPHTTDFALLFLPTEGLYAEALRRPGLSDLLQREYRVTIAGPTTLTALLNSLQMGFRTLAIEKRSSEVWQVLGAVKSEFGKFGDVLAKTREQIQRAADSIDKAEVRTRQITRKLRGVEALPDTQARNLLGVDTESASDAAELPDEPENTASGR
jgi:DNA recombination protein RmuC